VILAMALEDDIALFETVPTLALLGEQALRILAIGAEEQQVNSGTVLFYAGEPGNAGYIIQRGAFRLLPAVQRRGEAEITLGRGALIGELALISGNPRPATAIALEDATVIRISRTLFLKVLEGYPEAARTLRDVIAARLGQWTRELAPIKAKLSEGKLNESKPADK
jgi:CRP-like cAMP-binding protein